MLSKAFDKWNFNPKKKVFFFEATQRYPLHQ